LQRAFRLFRQSVPARKHRDAASAADPTLPADAVNDLIAGNDPYQLDVAAAQEVSVSGMTVWAVPGASGACLTWTAESTRGNAWYPAVCAATARVDAGLLWGVAGHRATPTAAASYVLVGLAPDANGGSLAAIASSGEAVSLPVVDNVYVWSASPLPASLTVLGAAGQATTLDKWPLP
jgi:hypothetical protein